MYKRQLYRGADILIFDEPTAVLTPSEIDELMAIMKNLVKEGKSIVLITHKLDEIRAVSNRVTVIRRGKSIQTVEIAGATNADLAEMMVGRSVSFKTEKQAPQPKDCLLYTSYYHNRFSLFVEFQLCKRFNISLNYGKIVL